MSTILRSYTGAGGETHTIRMSGGATFTMYCDCPAWKFSKVSPKTCKHLDRYRAERPSTSSVTKTKSSIGTDSNGAKVYPWDWLRDKVTGFAMRAVSLSAEEVDIFYSAGGEWVIRKRDSVVFIPSFGEAIPHGKIAACDREAYRAARMGASAPQHMPPVSLDGPSVFEKLDWL